MAFHAQQLRSRAAGFIRHSRTRKTAIWLVAIFVALGVLVGLVAPPILRFKIAGDLSQKLHRNVSIEQIRINPYAMTATVRGFVMNERQSKATALSFDELYINLQLQSLIRLAPVIKELRLSKPYINVARNEDYKYNFQDLIDEFTSGAPGGPTPQFALNNIQVTDGRIDFDDRPEKTKHSISSIRLGIPFISSLPSYTDIFVRPSFSANVNGAPVQLGGQAKPFDATHDSVIELDIDNLKISKYLEYSPIELNFNVRSGELNGKIKAAFRTAKDKPSLFDIGGTLGLRNLAVEQNGGVPVLKLARLDVLIDTISVFANRATVKSIKADGIELRLTRHRDGSMNIAHLVSMPDKPISNEQKKESKPYFYEIADVLVDSGTLYFEDQTSERSFKTRLDNLHLAVKGLTTEAEKQADVEVSFETDAKERFRHAGKLTLSPFAAQGKLDIENLRPGGLGPYYQNASALDIKEGFIDVSAGYSLQSSGDRSDLKLNNIEANLRSLRLELPGQPEPLWRIPSLVIKDGSIDVNSKTVLIGAIEATGGSGYIQREKDGTLNYARVVRPQLADPVPMEPAKTEQTDWKIEAKQIGLDKFQINVDDRSAASPIKFIFSDVFGRIDNFSNVKNQPGKVRLRTRINKTGLLRVNGTAGTNPISAKLAVEGRDIDLLPLQPYFGDQVNFSLTGGRVSTKGTLSYESVGSAPARANYQGGVELNDVATIEKSDNQDLFKWKVLGLDQLQFTSEPLQLKIGQVNLADFYSRVIIGPDGKVNLQNLARNKEESPKQTQQAALPQPVATAAAADEAKASDQRVTIGKINLQGGNINFSDFLIKPNYSANLTDVQGTISELKPETPGDIDIKARLDQDAPVDISGKINPLGKELFLDIVADARDIEMNPFSPYSGKYVGYGIERGKLSFNVKYRLENRQLTAQNKIILNQLTFGDKIESPEATKLPVLLAVALLKDRNGVIDVELPISGSLDDPQFSVGGIVLRLVINLITKAVTAPFALLGSVFGGSSNGEELSYLEFDSGRATLSEAAHNKIATLAKAMNNRPALKVELTGRTDPVSDPEGLKRVAIERKVKAQKLKDLSRDGAAPKSIDEVQVNGSEYPQYLKAAYGEESFPKPRNAIGLARNLPVSEMEKLMIQHTTVNDDDLRQLANRRAEVARDAIVASGQVGSERVSIAPAKPLSSEESAKVKGRLNRVDFSLR